MVGGKGEKKKKKICSFARAKFSIVVNKYRRAVYLQSWPFARFAFGRSWNICVKAKVDPFRGSVVYHRVQFFASCDSEIFVRKLTAKTLGPVGLSLFFSIM